MPRLFTGLEIPPDIGQTLSSLRGGLPGARWIDPENYHVTLRFIGDIDGAAAQPYAQRMAARSDPDAAGRLLAWNADAPSSVDFHFFDTAAGTFTPSAYLSGLPSGHIASQPALVASGLLYLRHAPARLVQGNLDQGVGTMLVKPQEHRPERRRIEVFIF